MDGIFKGKGGSNGGSKAGGLFSLPIDNRVRTRRYNSSAFFFLMPPLLVTVIMGVLRPRRSARDRKDRREQKDRSDQIRVHIGYLVGAERYSPNCVPMGAR